MFIVTGWSGKEEELFSKAWMSLAYGRVDLVRIFGRSWNSLKHKAQSLEMPPRQEIEGQARLDAIVKVLQEDHVI